MEIKSTSVKKSYKALEYKMIKFSKEGLFDYKPLIRALYTNDYMLKTSDMKKDILELEGLISYWINRKNQNLSIYYPASIFFCGGILGYLAGFLSSNINNYLLSAVIFLIITAVYMGITLKACVYVDNMVNEIIGFYSIVKQNIEDLIGKYSL